ncbi:MAG: amidase [Egibacteraceae bacterium]
MADDQIARMTAHELLAGYRDRELSPVEATQASLERIDSLDQHVNGFCLTDADAALAAARASQERYAAGQPAGRLDGVPVAIKDVFLTAGWPTRKGSKAIGPEGPWPDDAPAVARVREHGAVLVGKTTTPELGWKGVTDSPLAGVTRNPWDPTRTAEGSSGGSAVAVALGMTPLATGTDGGGSIRIPAGFSGVAGIKPTFGRVPHYPPSPFGTLAHAGPMARTVADLALMLDVMAGPDARDWYALPPSDGRFSEQLGDGIAGVRIAFSPTLGYVDVDPEVADTVEAAVHVLGADVERLDPGFTDPVDTYDVLWHVGAANVLAGFDAQAREMMDPGLLAIAEHGRRFSAVDLAQATARRDTLGVHMSQFHEDYDLLVMPTLPIPAFEAGRNVPADWPEPGWPSWTPFSYPFNLTQQPALSVPCGFTSGGLPVGLQIVGAKYDDALVLRAGHTYQVANPLFDVWPDWAA